MKTFQWSTLFETGLADVDDQHRRLVELVNNLGEEIDSGTPEHVDATLEALADYTVYHFGCEEKIMDTAGVAAEYAERHRATHRRFVAQVREWMATRRASGQLSASQLLDYLANWLIFHILGDDQSLGRQIRAIQAGTDPASAYATDRSSDDPRTDILLGALRRLYGDLLERNERLVEAQQDLQTLNASLEQRVAERTVELEAANALLMDERQRAIEAEKMASLGRLVAGFAHEVNTPVGVAIGAVSQTRQVVDEFRQLLQQDEVSEQEVGGHLSMLAEASELAMSNLQRAASLVQSFKRTAVDQSSDAEREYRLDEVIDDVIHNLSPMFKRTQIALVTECAPELSTFGQPGAMNQILTNLYANALVHAYADGQRGGTIVVRVRGDGENIEIEFKDDGNGMPPEVVAKVFEPFYTTRRDTGGSGLGLYIVYNLTTRQLGGSIRCESASGVGTRFVIRIPKRSRPQPE